MCTLHCHPHPQSKHHAALCTSAHLRSERTPEVSEGNICRTSLLFTSGHTPSTVGSSLPPSSVFIPDASHTGSWSPQNGEQSLPGHSLSLSANSDCHHGCCSVLSIRTHPAICDCWLEEGPKVIQRCVMLDICTCVCACMTPHV